MDKRDLSVRRQAKQCSAEQLDQCYYWLSSASVKPAGEYSFLKTRFTGRIANRHLQDANKTPKSVRYKTNTDRKSVV